MKKVFSMWRAGLAAAFAMVGFGTSAWASQPYAVGWGMNYNTPTDPSAMDGITAVAAGYHHSMSIVNTRVYSWGGTNETLWAVPSAGRTNVVAVTAGDAFCAALRKDGTVVSWGRSDITSKFSGDFTNGVTQIAAGETHLLVLKKDGGVLAAGITNSAPECQVPATARSGVVQVAAGAHFSLALKTNGTIVAWGDASQDGGVTNIPASLKGKAKKIAAGHYHALAVTTSGGVVVWGAFTNYYSLPSAAKSGVKDVAAGYEFSMALKTNGTVVVWGDDTFHTATSNQPSLKAGASQISAGFGHCLAAGKGLEPYWLESVVPEEAYVGHAYAGHVTATGMPAVTYHKAGAWPSWLTLNSKTGVLSGKPAATAKPVKFGVIASNIYGMVSNAFSVTVDTRVDPPVFITSSVDDGEIGLPYSFTIEASNSPVFFLSQTEKGYDLPGGLGLSADGTISGIPTNEYSSIFYVTASNEAGFVEREFTMAVTAPTAAPSFLTTTLAPAILGEPYSEQIKTTRLATFSLVPKAGTLPAGLSLGKETGIISGTPTVAGRFPFKVAASNTVGTATTNFVLEVWSAPVITTAALPNGNVGDAYQRTIATPTNCLPAPVFSLASGRLPDGLTLNATNGLLSGTLSKAGTYGFAVTASNAVGIDTRDYSVTVDSIARARFTSMSFSNTSNKPVVTLTWTNAASTTRLYWSTNFAATNAVWKSLGKKTSPWTGPQTNVPVFYRLVTP